MDSRVAKTCASKKPPALRDLLHHRGRDGRAPEDGRGRGRRHRHLRLLCRAAAGRGESVPSAQRPDRRPPRILLGRPARSSTQPEFFSSLLQADLSRSAVRARRSFTCRWISKIAKCWRSCSREKRSRKVEIHTPQRGQKKALLDLVETNAKHSFDAALPRAEALVASHSGSAAGRAESARTRRSASSASTSRTSRAPTKWPAWWCGKTGG